MLVLDFVTITLLLWMWDELGNSVSKGSRSRFFRQSKSDWISNRYLCLTVLIASRLFDFGAAVRSELGFMSSWDNLSLLLLIIIKNWFLCIQKFSIQSRPTRKCCVLIRPGDWVTFPTEGSLEVADRSLC